jgi:DNA-binding IclR family transcriptional regulator
MKPATSIAKVCRLLDAFRSRGSMGVVELSQHTDLVPSDVHRILKSLEAFGYVEQDAQSKKYHLGLELLRLGHVVLRRLELRTAARPLLCQLSEQAEATANLAIFHAHELDIIFVEQIDSPAEVQIKLRIGSHVNPHATSVGKVLCAYMDPETCRKVLEKDGMGRKTSKTITDRAGLEQEFERVRERGYALDLEEAVEGACCAAAPIRDHRGEVIAAVSVSMMATRFLRWRERQVAAMVKSTAARISVALGYQPAPAVPRAAARAGK